jgi:hypothetical protein
MALKSNRRLVLVTLPLTCFLKMNLATSMYRTLCLSFEPLFLGPGHVVHETLMP